MSYGILVTIITWQHCLDFGNTPLPCPSMPWVITEVSSVGRRLVHVKLNMKSWLHTSKLMKIVCKGLQRRLHSFIGMSWAFMLATNNICAFHIIHSLVKSTTQFLYTLASTMINIVRNTFVTKVVRVINVRYTVQMKAFPCWWRNAPSGGYFSPLEFFIEKLQCVYD